MIHQDFGSTFQGLPLTSEQQSEVRHYLKRKARMGQPWNTSELRGMLEDMLVPPVTEDGDAGDTPLERAAAAERAAAFVDEAMEPIEAYEEWNAAMETESMKGGRR
ncbi:hypothetical protein [Cupriavidus pauculus]|uniref:hypothetical protein n=1 Tax=Cupriavidus pauculus TaxID=82633 RepID=UPI001EE36D1B|nr:hypothetical protein [Cupriavidus pauculus]GJG98179.1 hypothetical protein CBA19C6_26840 [Cupriavidus pauculus]